MLLGDDDSVVLAQVMGEEDGHMALAEDDKPATAIGGYIQL